MIPEKALLNHIAILGKTGSGKTYTAKGIAEHLLREKRRVCVIDPIGAWWGLRSDVTGKKPAFPIVVFGGEHADIPLGQSHGAAIAEIIGTTETSAVLDTRLMTVGERTRFFTDFGETLLRKNRGPLHVILDEAHLFIPQGRVNDPQSGKMLHAGNNLVSLGRGVGLRVIMISQRPAKLHKDSLTQAETLIAMRLIAPQDRAAVEAWIGEWAEPAQGKELLKSLPSLSTGQGWVWAPELQILQRETFPRITTYDSSRAPDSDTAANLVLAKIDLPAIQERLEQVAADVYQNDPARLRKRIADLERELKCRPEAEPKVIEKPVITDEQVKRLESLSLGLEELTSDVIEEIRVFKTSIKDLKQVVASWERVTGTKKPLHTSPVPPPRPPQAIQQQPAGDLAPGQLKLLRVIAQYPSANREQLTVLCGFARSTRNEYLRQLNLAGLVNLAGDEVSATPEGIKAAGDFEPLPTGSDLADFWFEKLPPGETKILRFLCQRRGAIDRERIDSECGFSRSTRNEYLRKLIIRRLVRDDGRGFVSASEELF